MLRQEQLYHNLCVLYADAIGAAGLIYFSFTEGREAFEKAKGKECDCCHD